MATISRHAWERVSERILHLWRMHGASEPLVDWLRRIATDAEAHGIRWRGRQGFASRCGVQFRFVNRERPLVVTLYPDSAARLFRRRWKSPKFGRRPIVEESGEDE